MPFRRQLVTSLDQRPCDPFYRINNLTDERRGGLSISLDQDGKQVTEEPQPVSPHSDTFNWVAGAF